MLTHYLSITDGFEMADYDLLDEALEGNCDTLPVKNTSLLTEFANMADAQIADLKGACNVAQNSKNVDEYIQSVAQSIAAKFGESVANIITLKLINSSQFSSEEDEENSSPQSFCFEAALKILHESVDDAITSAKAFCFALSIMPENDPGTQLRQAHWMVNGIRPEIRYVPLAAIEKKTQRITFCGAYSVSKAWDFFALMGILTLSEGKTVKKCKNCGMYFVPVSKKDEIYCSNCRAVSYDKKIRGDEILSSYRKIYKTQSARKARNAHRPQINEKFDSWKRLAISKRNDCKAGFITLAEMEAAISTQEWLGGNGDTNGND